MPKKTAARSIVTRLKHVTNARRASTLPDFAVHKLETVETVRFRKMLLEQG